MQDYLLTMSREDSGEITFQDASDYFSEDEWKRLHQWQKELYVNVMKEIHQALLSLGPLIASTVFSLRAKEKGVPIPMDSQDLDRRNCMNRSPGDPVTNLDVFPRVKGEANLNMNSARDAEGEPHDCLSAEFPVLRTDVSLKKEEDPVSIFIEHLGAEVGQADSNINIEKFRISDLSDQSKAKENMATERRCSIAPPTLITHPLSTMGSLHAQIPAVSPPPRVCAYRSLHRVPVSMHTLLHTSTPASLPRVSTYRPGRGRGRKAPPFTMGEMRALVLGITPHYRQLYHTGTASNAVKRELWQEIRHSVAFEGIIMRTVGQLKIKYRQMRRPVMQKLSRHQAALFTHGTASLTSLGLSDMENLIACSVVPESIEEVSDIHSDELTSSLEEAQEQDILTDEDDSDALEGEESDTGEGVQYGTEENMICQPSAANTATLRLLTSAPELRTVRDPDCPISADTQGPSGVGRRSALWTAYRDNSEYPHRSSELVHHMATEGENVRDATERAKIDP